MSQQSYRSILFVDPTQRPGAQAPAPDHFRDLNLDQVVAAVTAGRDEYDLNPFFHTPLRTLDAIAYRHEVFQDLAEPALVENVTAFARGMARTREGLSRAAKLFHAYQKKRWFLDSLRRYCDTVRGLAEGLTTVDLASRGLRGLRDYLAEYTASPAFLALQAETTDLRADLDAVRYCVFIRGHRVRVSHYHEEDDYGWRVAQTFARFRQGSARDHRTTFTDSLDVDHVEGMVLDLVARLHPTVFGALDAFCERYGGPGPGRPIAFAGDPVLATFDREVQFYLAYLEYLTPLRQAGLAFCHPEMSAISKQVAAEQTYDLALAAKLVTAGRPVVRNDFHLTGPERVMVVTGPNQGGKTTFARAFGQVHYLASIGVPVPGERARLFLSDRMYTHFEREEDLDNLTGKLQDDLVRIHAILAGATERSIIIMNEIFTSTTLADALWLAHKVMARIIRLDSLGICVTFLDELASFSEKTVSMVSTVAADDPATLTYRVVRRPADGVAYAIVLAQRYGLTYERLTKRVAR
ncbi:MAG TPA: hypothetical protein VH561_00060 [Micromonosporaceae bacterium]|jgi:hypothetical protein